MISLQDFYCADEQIKLDKVLILVAGLPNSGKSTFAKFIAPEYNYAADQYFESPNGDYKWDANKLGAAHKYCRDSVENAMNENCTPIAVHNTFTTEKELKPYLELAERYGYKVFSIVVEKRHEGTNNHNVPEETIKMMEQKLKNRIKLVYNK